MVKIDGTRTGCKDVFNAFLVSDADYAGLYDFPVIRRCNVTPRSIIPFSKCMHSNEYDACIHFYEDDCQFERVWNNPRKYLPILKRFSGVILPDFSLYRDMPFNMQLWNIYRSRAIGSRLQRDGGMVIPNVRYADRRTYSICCDGISPRSVIAMGTHGCMKDKINRTYFLEGLDIVIKRLQPMTVIIYGTLPNSIIELYSETQFYIFPSLYSATHVRKL